MTYKDKVYPGQKPEQNRAGLLKLTPNDWAAWMKDRLHKNDGWDHQNDRSEIEDSDQFPYQFPHAIFREIAIQLEEARPSIFVGLNVCLDEVYSSKETWKPQAIDRLLLLSNDFGSEYGIFRENIDKIKRFLGIFRPNPIDLVSSSPEEVDLYGRTIQTLVGIGARLPFEFWAAQLEISKQYYAAMSLMGAFTNSLEDGFNLMQRIDWKIDSAKNMIFSNLVGRLLSDQVYHADFAETFESQKTHLPIEAQETIEGVLKFVKESQKKAGIAQA
ncbi:MAG: hypothetical protein AABX38_02930 [Candidatus Micrarchaeota archaeon]